MAYGQYCGIARALDLVGDRWTLLIIRELMIGRSRYQEIRFGLPGVATNLLADRLRRLEADGLVGRDGVGYVLTPRGEDLRPVLRELVRWSEPLMLDGPADDHFDGAWLMVALEALLQPSGPGLVEIHSGEATIHVLSDGSLPEVSLGPAVRADAILTADGGVVLGLVSGHISVADAVSRGVATIEGDVETAAAVLRGRKSTETSRVAGAP